MSFALDEYCGPSYFIAQDLSCYDRTTGDPSHTEIRKSDTIFFSVASGIQGNGFLTGAGDNRI